jgi:competence protein ComEC
MALFFVLLLHPLAVLSAGFWLSFAAVSVIFYGLGARVGQVTKWKVWVKLQLIVSIGLIPFTLLWFQNASLVSPIANAIVIPIVGFIVVPLSLLASVVSFISVPFSHLLFHLAVWVLSIAWHILVWFSGHSFGAWQYAVSNNFIMFSVVLGVLVLLAPKGWPARWLGIIFITPLFLIHPTAPKIGTAKFTLLDVGQGLASVVRTQHHVLVYDTGAKWGPNFNMGEAVVVPFLRQMGIGHIDMLMISHGDNDHIGGAASVLSVMPVAKVLTSVSKRFAKGRAQLCLAGMHWQWDEVKFAVLYPTASHLGLDNDSSCLLRVSAGDKHLLLTGDIEKTSEQFLLSKQKVDLAANVIVAPHHGSKTSSTLAFVKAVAPQWVFYPVGYLNRYHFPNQIVRHRYQTVGAQSLATDSAGAISFTLSQNKAIKPIAYRKAHRHFWWQ